MRVPSKEFQFVGPTYLLPSPVLDAQRSINLYPEPGIGSSKAILGFTGRPGLTLFETLPNSPVRALWAGNDRLFAVGGRHVYELSAGGGIVTDYGSMGGSGSLQAPCRFVQNGGSAAFQLGVLDSSASTLTGNMFNVNPVGPALNAVFNATDMEYADGFQVCIANGNSLNSAGNPNQINSSNFGDLTTWQALNYVIRTGNSDLVNGLAWLNAMLFIFGAKTTEVWYDAGNLGWPFVRVNGGQINLGLCSTFSIAKFYNTVVFLGADDTGFAQVYMMQGMNPTRISTAAVEYLISQQGNLFTARAYGYQEAGHTFYVLVFPQTGFTIVYDLTTGLWHERTYASALPWCFASLANFGFGSGGQNFVGDYNSGNIYTQSIQSPSDNGTAIAYSRTAPHVTDGNQWHKYNRFEVSMPGSNSGGGCPAPTLDYSDDGGQTFGGRTIALQQAQNSARGVSSSMRRFFATQLGRSRDRVFKLSISDSSNLIRIANAYLDIDE
jgi:hypothetical protein